MQISDWINITLCVLSFILAAISVVTVVITLKQNHQMIKNSTRPYIVAMPQMTNFQEPLFYLVIKNFGASGATVKGMTCNVDLSTLSYREELIPFNNIKNTFIAPGQMLSCSLDSHKFKENGIKDFEVVLKYSDGIEVYEEKFIINYKAYVENVHVRAATEGKELRTISYTLQDMVEKNF